MDTLPSVSSLSMSGRIIRDREGSVGSLRTAAVSPRDLFRLALEEHAASIIVFHNHPSGDPSPSSEDVQFTRKLPQAGTVVESTTSLLRRLDMSR
jgi:DNA repair protein RadC